MTRYTRRLIFKDGHGNTITPRRFDELRKRAVTYDYVMLLIETALFYDDSNNILCKLEITYHDMKGNKYNDIQRYIGTQSE